MKLKLLAATLTFCLSINGWAEEDEWASWGGRIAVWPKDPGAFAIVDAQSTMSTEEVASVSKQLFESFPINLQLQKGKAPDIRNMSVALRELNAKGGIWFVDDRSLPIVLAAVENGWGILNIAALAADNPNKDVLNLRVTKEFNRLFGYLNGVSESMTVPGCVFKPAHGLAGLDALACRQFSPEAYSKIVRYLDEEGYKQIRVSSYYEACEQGWAPAPTNAVQKQIWDKVHALPKAPIKIKPETTKVTK